jgi:hypothetical protein
MEEAVRNNQEEKKMDEDALIHRIPEKVLVNVMSFLDVDTFLQVLSVCKRWNDVVQRNIVFFEEWFAGGEDEEDNDDNEDGEKASTTNEEDRVSKPKKEDEEIKKVEEVEKKEKKSKKSFTNEKGEVYNEDQLLTVRQIIDCKEENYWHLLGIADPGEDGKLSEEMGKEAKTVYKRLSLLVHPDRNKAPGSAEAFGIMKKALDLVLKPRVRTEGKSFTCPSPECTFQNVLSYSHGEGVEKGLFSGTCKVGELLFSFFFLLPCVLVFILFPQPTLMLDSPVFYPFILFHPSFSFSPLSPPFRNASAYKEMWGEVWQDLLLSLLRQLVGGRSDLESRQHHSLSYLPTSFRSQLPSAPTSCFCICSHLNNNADDNKESTNGYSWWSTQETKDVHELVTNKSFWRERWK